MKAMLSLVLVFAATYVKAEGDNDEGIFLGNFDILPHAIASSLSIYYRLNLLVIHKRYTAVFKS